jgi:voltage-dependent potassium channel beta subunit
MEYRRLGSSGLRTSAISYGSWATMAESASYDETLECLCEARELGINLLDTADAYASGEAERFIGRALRDLAWPRWSVIVATKLYWGLHDDVNMSETLNRKYLLTGIDESLKRLQLDFVDVLFCHRPDPGTSIEEIVWTMSDIVASGRALYWGTSEWPASLISEATTFATLNKLRSPIVEQPQYNVIHRGRFESEYVDLATRLGLGLVTWSPLASGLLTGKYLDGVPKGSRLSRPSYAWLRIALTQANADAFIRAFADLGKTYNATAAQLAIARCLTNPAVSSVILGARTRAQLTENAAGLVLYESLADDGRRAFANEVNELISAHELPAELST